MSGEQEGASTSATEVRPLVSVVIPTFNRAQLVRESIESVLAQTYENLEVLVIDDGSTDNTRAVVELIDDLRIRYIKQDNRGVSAARNHGLDVSRGELVAFLDSDDLWDPRKLEYQVRLFSNRETGWAYCNVRYFGTREAEDQDFLFSEFVPVRGMILKNLFVKNDIVLSSLIVRRHCFEQVGKFSELYSWFGEEKDLYLRLAAQFSADYVDEALCVYRVPDEDESDRPPENSVRWFEKSPFERGERRFEIMNKALSENPSLKNELTRDEMMSSFYEPAFNLALNNLSLGHRKRTRKLIQPCLSFDPWWTQAWLTLLLSYSPFLPSMLKKRWEPRMPTG